jgi:serine/threonine-protein kinase
MTIADRLTASLAGRYHVERELGRGGMGAVYLARDLRHDREVAVKVLDAQYGAAVGPERFLAEIKITASLDHSHILTLIDSGEADGLLYYVMPYVRGESLRARLDRQHQLDIDAAVRIASQVASALDHAHRHGVIHRDIKPENILLRDDEALLADFGIALPSTETASVRLTEVGHSLGTPQYMSPEQATGERTLDARSDVYSLGAVTYEMLAGEPPLTGASMQAIIAKLMVERPTPLRVMRQSVTPAMEAAVAKALAKAPADRFASAGEFAAALRAPSRVQGDARRWLWSAVGVVAVLGVAGGLLAYQRLAPSTMHISIGQTEQFTSDAGLEIQPTISPDGGLIAYAAGTSARMRIYIRPVGGGRTIPLSDDSLAVETQPRWSPDGGTLLFLTRDGVWSFPPRVELALRRPRGRPIRKRSRSAEAIHYLPSLRPAGLRVSSVRDTKCIRASGTPRASGLPASSRTVQRWCQGRCLPINHPRR